MSIFGYLIRSYRAKVIKTIFRTKSNVEYRQHKISGNACGRIAEIRGMQALYPAAVVSVQIAEVPDLVFFRFAHVTISVRQVFSVAEAARPMLDRLEFDFPRSMQSNRPYRPHSGLSFLDSVNRYTVPGSKRNRFTLRMARRNGLFRGRARPDRAARCRSSGPAERSCR